MDNNNEETLKTFKADIVVFRNQNGKLVVRPSVFIVELTGGKNNFRIRNDAEEDVQIVIQHDSGKVTETLTPSRKGPPNHKKEIDVTGIKQEGSCVVYYQVNIGPEEAEGESAPALIIDD